MSARDELALVLANAQRVRNGSSTLPSADHASRLAFDDADAILAAGYSKPRTITTTEELETLTDGSILISGARIKRYEGVLWRVRRGMVVLIGRELDGITPYAFFKDPLPATLIYSPEES